MFSVNLHEFKPIQAMDCINLNMIIHKYELLPGLIGAVFINRNKTMIRALTYDGTGFWLMTKRLSKGKFTGWPKGSDPISKIAAIKLKEILSGHDHSRFSQINDK